MLKLTSFLILTMETLSVMAADVQIQPGKQTENWLTTESATNSDQRAAKIPYLLFTPQNYSADQKMPLMLFLHGWGESGEGDFDLIKVHGPPKLVEMRPDFPFVVVSPQCPKPPYNMDKIIAAWDEAQLVQLLDHVQKHVSIDKHRVYVTVGL